MQLSLGGKNLIPCGRWRRSALAFALAALFIFVLNLSFAIWATTAQGNATNIYAGRTNEPAIGIILEGDRSYIKAWNTGLHVAINIMSTILLAGSNYCMQCIMAPTRTEIIAIHQKKKWLHIGVPSVRNFCNITWKKKTMWLLLALSSLPIHLLFNSLVFASISTNSYYISIVNADFLGDRGIEFIPHSERFLWPEIMQRFHEDLKNRKLHHRNLTECLDDYGKTFQSSRGDLLLVVSNETILTNKTDTYHPRLFRNSEATGFDWICEERRDSELDTPCEETISGLKNNPDTWKPYGYRIQDCYSQETPEHSKLLFNSALCWIVTILTLFKGIMMLFVAYGGGERPILTMGDAVTSFLRNPDESTKGMCLNSKESFKRTKWDETLQQFNPTPRRKFAAGSLRQWVTCVLLFVLALTLCSLLLGVGIRSLRDGAKITNYGLGVIHSDTIMSLSKLLEGYADRLLINVILANTPQVIMSLIYINYNALLTGISLITEWDRFKKERKGLRVSSGPEGYQRETHFLQLPYRYSLPLAGFSSLIHWLISQSIFLVIIDTYNTHGSDTYGRPDDTAPFYSRRAFCGWSPVGIICVLVAGVIMVAFLVASGCRRLRFGGIPVAVSCSAAISAACHPIPEEPDAWKKEVCWGVTRDPKAEPRHCSFSSEPVEYPVKGELYE